nr:immunoglobulin heavy chain junction region [Mus musculus]NSM03991.1 immunoglobulin heavy chain junction region [Mus musculus]NSM04587.1 immunoglobulin heavy chain junction region [Mus musculus]NSM05706.1 immunoglobulin heavy chain junction region [Mus musculus]NSM06985.1 immunoglobulin heavy chain junction region [Mus musculus]
CARSDDYDPKNFDYW